MPGNDKYPKPAVTVDIIALCWDGQSLALPLITRKHDPFEGQWAIPGGFLEMDETLEECARRELKEETSVDSGEFARGPIFDAVDRDPRERVISVPHATLLRRESVDIAHGDDAADARLFPVGELPDALAFDHADMLGAMLPFAAEAIERGELGGDLPPEERAGVISQLRKG